MKADNFPVKVMIYSGETTSRTWSQHKTFETALRSFTELSRRGISERWCPEGSRFEMIDTVTGERRT